jgi:hypothetical protein
MNYERRHLKPSPSMGEGWGGVKCLRPQTVSATSNKDRAAETFSATALRFA